MLITASLDRTVVIWDGISGEALRCLLGHGDEVYSLCLVEKEAGMFDIVSGGGEGEVILWNTDCQQDVSSISLLDRPNTAPNTPMKSFSEQAASMNEFKTTFHDRNLISIFKQTKFLTDGDSVGEESGDADSFNEGEDEDVSSVTFVSCPYGSNVIKVYEGDCRRNLKTSREFTVGNAVHEDNNGECDTSVSSLRITALSTMNVPRGDWTTTSAVDTQYYILAGDCNGDIHVLDSFDGSSIKTLSDENNTTVSHDKHVMHASVVAICVRNMPANRGDSSRCIHVIASRSNGSVVIFDFEAGEVNNSFRDYDEDVSCLALLEVNFALLDSFNDGGFRFSSVNRRANEFNFGIVTGSTSGMIKIWKYNTFGGGWAQCFEISTALEDNHHRGCAISSLRVLWNDLTPLGQDSSMRNLSHFQLVAGYFDGSVNMWDIETKTITLVLDEKCDQDASFQRSDYDFAVTDLHVTKRTDGYEIICVRNNKKVVLWRNIDINNLPGTD